MRDKRYDSIDTRVVDTNGRETYTLVYPDIDKKKLYQLMIGGSSKGGAEIFIREAYLIG